MEYDCGILGYWFNPNYGAALTTYALYRFFERRGFNTFLIDIPDYVFSATKKFRAPNSLSRNFIETRCQISKRYSTESQMGELNDICSTFILGSDQMWHWDKGKFWRAGGFFFLDFVLSNKKKIGYSVSFGTDTFMGGDEDKAILSFFASRFDAISVREKRGISILANVDVKNVALTLDPIFFLNQADYRLEELAPIGYPSDSYVFVYVLEMTKEKETIVREYAKEKKLEIVYVGDLDNSEYSQTFSVEEWIFLLDNASFVITDSYHGLCMSLIFNKNCVVLHPRGEIGRFTTLFELLNIQYEIDAQPMCMVFEEQRKELSSILTERISESEEWLLNQIIRKNESNVDIYDVSRLMTNRTINRMIFNNEKTNVRINGINENIRENYLPTINQVKRYILPELEEIKKQLIVTRAFIVKQYLEKRLQGKKVAIRCAGYHTRELLRIIGGYSFLKCVWDKNYGENYFENLPCVRQIDDLEKYDVDTILISTFKYRNEIKMDLENVKQYEIVDFYEELGREGICFDSEYYWFS